MQKDERLGWQQSEKSPHVPPWYGTQQCPLVQVQSPPQPAQSAGLEQTVSRLQGMVVLVVDVDVEVDVDVDVDVEVDVDVDVAVPDVDVVPPVRQALLAFRVEARGHPALQAEPAGQQRRFEPRPHGVVPLGHPHRPWVLSTQATPLLQQRGPQGVVPLGQQQDVDGWEHAWPL